ncbi:MAG: sigma-70 family RNA polymerase sigma factor [Limnothrix sp.]
MTNKSTFSNAELWQDFRFGSNDALGEIYARHASLVYGVALQVLRKPTEAEDLTQDIFVKLLSASGYDPSRGSLRTFLIILTRSRAIDRLRSQKSVKHSVRPLSGTEAIASHETPEVIVENFEQAETVQLALAKLSASQREVLNLSFYEGLTQVAIAEKLNKPLGTVKSAARRGLLKLRTLLQEDGIE